MARKIVLLPFLAMIAAAGAGTWLLSDQARSNSGSSGGAPPPPEVPVAEVVVRKVARSSEFTGHTAAVESVEVRPRVGGYIQSVSVPEGGLVTEGQLLFQIDPRPFQAALDQAKAQLAQAEARLAQAEADFARAEQLIDKGITSRERYEDAVATRRERQAQVQAAKAAITTAELDLSYTRVTAPIAGRVDRMLVTQGNLVAGGSAGQPTLLTTIVSVDPAYVYFDIDEATYLEFVEKARPGKPDSSKAQLPVRVGLVTDRGFPHKGKLDFLGNRIDRSTGTIRARAILPNPDGRLAPGLFARVRLVTGEPRETVLIDDQAVGTDQGKRYVLVLGEGNKVVYRPVTLGPVVGGLRTVASGLAAGETVIIKGLVGPGMQVTPRKTAMGGAKADAAEFAAAE